jgi:hypothetical protein
MCMVSLCTTLQLCRWHTGAIGWSQLSIIIRPLPCLWCSLECFCLMYAYFAPNPSNGQIALGIVRFLSKLLTWGPWGVAWSCPWWFVLAAWFDSMLPFNGMGNTSIYVACLGNVSPPSSFVARIARPLWWFSHMSVTQGFQLASSANMPLPLLK